MNRQRTEHGSTALIIVIIILVIGILGGLGYALWYNFANKSAEPTPTTPNTTTEEPNVKCVDGADEKATGGVFCSGDVGVKFEVPSIFRNKIKAVENYEVFKSPLDPSKKESAGKSEKVFQAKLTGNDKFTFTIAKEPLRSGYVGVPNGLTDSYYDQKTGLLTAVSSPTRHYDSDSDSYTTTGTYKTSTKVPYFNLGKLKVFNGTLGDADVVIITYFAVINNKIVTIQINHRAYIGDAVNDPTTIEASDVYNELEAGVRKLEVL